MLVWAMLRVDSRPVIDEKINRTIKALLESGPANTIVRIVKECVKVLPTVQVSCAWCAWCVRVVLVCACVAPGPRFNRIAVPVRSYRWWCAGVATR